MRSTVKAALYDTIEYLVFRLHRTEALEVLAPADPIDDDMRNQPIQSSPRSVQVPGEIVQLGPKLPSTTSSLENRSLDLQARGIKGAGYGLDHPLPDRWPQLDSSLAPLLPGLIAFAKAGFRPAVDSTRRSLLTRVAGLVDIPSPSSVSEAPETG